MRGKRGLFLVRRLALFILGICIIVFVSSPAVLFSNIKQMDNQHILDFSWLEGSTTGNLLKNHAAPTMIILINVGLLVIIDLVCLYEAYETHSLYQEAVYVKSFIYLILNMLIIPALTLSNGAATDDITQTQKTLSESHDSLWSFMQMRGFNIS